jgi:hypothetical protein
MPHQSNDKEMTTMSTIIQKITKNNYVVTDLFYEDNYYCFIKVYSINKHHPLVITIPPKYLKVDSSLNEKIKHHSILSISCSKNSVLELQNTDNDIDDMYDNFAEHHIPFNNIDINEVFDSDIITLKRQSNRFNKVVENLPYKLIIYTNSYIVNIHHKNTSVNCYKIQTKNSNIYNKNIIITTGLRMFLTNINENSINHMYKKLYSMQFRNITKFINKLKDESDISNMNNIKKNINIINERRIKCKATLDDSKYKNVHTQILNKLQIADKKMSHLLLTTDQYIADKITFDKHINNNNKLLSNLLKIL